MMIVTLASRRGRCGNCRKPASRIHSAEAETPPDDLEAWLTMWVHDATGSVWCGPSMTKSIQAERVDVLPAPVEWTPTKAGGGVNASA